MDIEQSAQIFRALGDHSRLQILSLLKSGEQCGSDLLPQLAISQSTLSHHMKILTESGLVAARKAGKATYYSLSPVAAMQTEQALACVFGQVATPVAPPPIKKKPKNQFETWL